MQRPGPGVWWCRPHHLRLRWRCRRPIFPNCGLPQTVAWPHVSLQGEFRFIPAENGIGRHILVRRSGRRRSWGRLRRPKLSMMAAGAQIEVLLDQGGEILVAQLSVRSSCTRCWVGLGQPDGITELPLQARSRRPPTTRLLGHMAGRIGSEAVPPWVGFLAGEGTNRLRGRCRRRCNDDFCGRFQARIALGTPPPRTCRRVDQKTGGARSGWICRSSAVGVDDDVLPEVVGDCAAAGRPSSLMPFDHGRVAGGDQQRVSISHRSGFGSRTPPTCGYCHRARRLGQRGRCGATSAGFLPAGPGYRAGAFNFRVFRRTRSRQMPWSAGAHCRADSPAADRRPRPPPWAMSWGLLDRVPPARRSCGHRTHRLWLRYSLICSIHPRARSLKSDLGRWCSLRRVSRQRPGFTTVSQATRRSGSMLSRATPRTAS